MSMDFDEKVWDMPIDGDHPEGYDDPDDLDEPDSIVVLTDENGNEVSFEFLDLVEYEGSEYVVLLPADEVEEDEDAGRVVILRVSEEGPDGMESYESVEDPGVLEAVYEIFKEKFKDEFDFTD